MREIIGGLSAYDSATVQTAMIRVRGYAPVEQEFSGPALKCFYAGANTVVGLAVTGKVMPLRATTKTLDMNDAYYRPMADNPLPVVGVLGDVEADRGRGAMCGDIMAYRHKALGAVGVVLDGSVRDVPGIIQADCPLWATGRVPGGGQFGLVEAQVPVKVADLTIAPDDILVCDGDGIVRVPREIAAETIKVCQEVRDKEARTLATLQQPNLPAQDYLNT